MSESSNDYRKKIESGIDLRFAIAPEKITSSGGATNQEIAKIPRSKRGLIIGLIGTAAAATLAVPVLIGISSEHGSQGAKPPKAIESSAPVTSSEAPSAPPEAIPTAESLKLDPSLINNPEALAKTYKEVTLTGWINSGSGESNAKLARNSGNSTTFADGIATEYDKIYEDALLPANWHSIQSLVDFASSVHSVHAQTLDYNYNTMPSLNIDSANKEAYAGGYTFVSLDKVVNNADASVTITDIELPYNNANKNVISQLSSQTVDGKKVSSNMTYKVEEGKLVIINQGAGQEIN